MPPDDDNARRGVVPRAAGRSLWLAAVWTGAGAALVAAVVAIVAVAVCWLPAAGESGSADSAIRAGLITFLAGLHGGATVDGLDAAFLPLGLTIAIGLIAWQAGSGLADVADDLDERDPGRLLRAVAVQAFAFAVTCAIAAGLSPLGTSSVAPIGAFVAGLLLFTITGGVALARQTALRDEWATAAPPWLGPAARAAAAVLAVYLAAGALLVVGSLIAHHAQVEALSREVGGGWSGIPVLLLGLLAAPNAAIAAAAYLAGPGFAVGAGTTVALGSTPRGTVPSFPVLAAVPHGPAGWFGWLLAALTPVVAGAYAAALAQRAPQRWRVLAGGVVGAAGFGLVLAWQGGGAIGSGRLHAVGASPWQFGLAVGAGGGAVAAILLGLQAVADLVRGHQQEDPDYVPLSGLGSSVTTAVSAAASTASNAAATAASTVAAAVRHQPADEASEDTSEDDPDGVVGEAQDGPKGDQLAG